MVSSGQEKTATKDVKDEMKIKLHMDGDVNGYKFKIEGNGQGKPYEGTQTINLTVTNGGPLPFAYDILTAAFEYGNRVFTQYPPDIPDYFKQTFPNGYSWERIMEFEDGAKCLVKSVISLQEADCFEYKIDFNGMGFPPNGPVMQKKTVKWEPSTEMMYMCGGELKGDVNMALLLEDGSHHRCDFKSIYKAMKPGIQLPKYHYIDHRIEILEQKNNYNQVVLYEKAAARYSPFPVMAAK
ncbi:GFP-like fluorescent chromoprotein cFP484 [Porites lutea]|uniref:GFP-like fluorescent chromoprotein cFP484 n=1 Tax=Porites lutea TaxID=51062 RepID=UPI003CC6826B